MTPTIRPGQDSDAPAFIALITRCWADYPGCVLHVDAEEPELHALASHFAARGGALWIAGEGIGMIATRPTRDGTWEICRVYVHPEHHGTGLAHRLMDLAEAHSGAPAFELWTDTRFGRAHGFYAKRGYQRRETRALGDLSNSSEYRYEKRPASGGALPTGIS